MKTEWKCNATSMFFCFFLFLNKKFWKKKQFFGQQQTQSINVLIPSPLKKKKFLLSRPKVYHVT